MSVRKVESSPFRSRSNRHALAPFSLVYSDIWRPSKIISSIKFNYFVTFIDDYSCMTWVYLLRNRFELFSVFTVFYAEIKNQFHTSIKIFRSDNAREYLSTDFQNFMTTYGILHQISCAYTPQQNGIAERKNRHFVDTARTLLIHMHVPVFFWDVAILTACYLINCMPSSMSHDQIPFSILFLRDFLYVLPPRVFGCTYFVYQSGPIHDKLSPRSIKCIFLGYSRSQKGYRCYSPVLHRVFISSDIKFFESISYFSHGFKSIVSHKESVSIGLPISLPTGNTSSSPVPIPSISPFRFDRPNFQIYQHRAPPEILSIEPTDSTMAPIATLPDSPTTPAPNLDVPIALCKGTRTKYLIDRFISYLSFSPRYSIFISSLASVSIPRTITEALAHSD